jgi:hypothetical protein
MIHPTRISVSPITFTFIFKTPPTTFHSFLQPPANLFTLISGIPENKRLLPTEFADADHDLVEFGNFGWWTVTVTESLRL